MRTIYLIRHGHPGFPFGSRMCLGSTDTPLGPLGRMQACLLGETLSDAGIQAVFTSPLSRCRDTAALLCRCLPEKPDPILVPELSEQHMGVWDGLDFDTIKAQYPELYKARGQDPLLVPPGAETLEEVRARVMPAFAHCLGCPGAEGSDAPKEAGNIAIVAHASVIQAILASLQGVPLSESRKLRLDYTGYVALTQEDTSFPDGIRVPQVEEALGKTHAMPLPLTPALAEKLLLAAAPGDRVIAHSRAVAQEAKRIAEALREGNAAEGAKGAAGDRAGSWSGDRTDDLLISAALLHDVARAEKNHAAVGALWLERLGYPDAADLIRQHHDWDGAELDEAAVLYLADKVIREDQKVSLEERFDKSREKCKTEEAIKAHERRYEAAKKLKTWINQAAGYLVVE